MRVFHAFSIRLCGKDPENVFIKVVSVWFKFRFKKSPVCNGFSLPCWHSIEHRTLLCVYRYVLLTTLHFALLICKCLLYFVILNICSYKLYYLLISYWILNGRLILNKFAQKWMAFMMEDLGNFGSLWCATIHIYVLWLLLLVCVIDITRDSL